MIDRMPFWPPWLPFFFRRRAATCGRARGGAQRTTHLLGCPVRPVRKLAQPFGVVEAGRYGYRRLLAAGSFEEDGSAIL